MLRRHMYSQYSLECNAWIYKYGQQESVNATWSMIHLISPMLPFIRPIAYYTSVRIKICRVQWHNRNVEDIKATDAAAHVLGLEPSEPGKLIMMCAEDIEKSSDDP